MHQLIGIVTACVCMAVCSQAPGGGDSGTWNEGWADAGQLRGSQRYVSSAAGAFNLSNVLGFTSGEGDPIDLIEIDVSSPSTFVMAPVQIPWDARLYLFRSDGEPLLAVDNSVDNQGQYTTSPWLRNSDNSMQLALNLVGETFGPGRYLIAITGTGRWPIYYDNGLPRALFNPFPGIGLALRAYNTTIWSWNAAPTAASGSWAFATTGVRLLLAQEWQLAEHIQGHPGASFQHTLNNSGSVGITMPVPCAPAGQSFGGHPVWYRMALDGGDKILIDTCALCEFDSVILVYQTTGPGGTYSQLLACNDDGCGSASGGSSAEFYNNACPSTYGDSPEYLVCVCAKGSTPGGVATLRVGPAPEGGQSDMNGDGVVDATDLAHLLSRWTSP